MKKAILTYLSTVVLTTTAGWCTMFFGAGVLPGRLDTFLGGVLVTASMMAAVTDLAYRKITNVTTFSGFFIIVIAYLMAAVFHVSEQTCMQLGILHFEQVLLGAGAGLFLTGIPYLLTRQGAGDVKLAVLFGMVLGPIPGIVAIVTAYLFAAALLFSYHFIQNGVAVSFRSIYKHVFSWALPLWVEAPNEEEAALLKSSIPLGPGFCLAAIAVLCYI